jgi:hypothetical protein
MVSVFGLQDMPQAELLVIYWMVIFVSFTPIRLQIVPWEGILPPPPPHHMEGGAEGCYHALNSI